MWLNRLLNCVNCCMRLCLVSHRIELPVLLLRPIRICTNELLSWLFDAQQPSQSAPNHDMGTCIQCVAELQSIVLILQERLSTLGSGCRAGICHLRLLRVSMGAVPLVGRLLVAVLFLSSAAQKLSTFNLSDGGPTMDLMVCSQPKQSPVLLC